ncbi:TIR domain-containing protein [Tardiphaga sp. 804_B3_N1_9]|uniref:TIR domain-containing protein n=1 Tax=Tardiphaga sp. 804_B3_N1_9 TaxID=3240786 RepID=UPI003F1F8DF1
MSPAVRSIMDALLAKPALPVAPSPPTRGFADLFAPPPTVTLGRGLLADFVAPPPPTFGMGLMANFTEPAPAVSHGLGGTFGNLFPPQAPHPPRRSIADLIAPPFKPVTPPPAVAPTVKRKAFFSFNYGDVIRVNVVRKAWMIIHRDSATMRRFFDSSLWEARKLTNPDAIKALIRYGVSYTSAVCVLVGSTTWERRWASVRDRQSYRRSTGPPCRSPQQHQASPHTNAPHSRP